jgi:hypothetical protein
MMSASQAILRSVAAATGPVKTKLPVPAADGVSVTVPVIAPVLSCPEGLAEWEKRSW